jgi:eukaryotic-like serine/threonine-protein kinase
MTGKLWEWAKSKLLRRPSLEVRFETLRPLATDPPAKLFLARDRQSGQFVGLKLLETAKAAKSRLRDRSPCQPGEVQIGVQLKHARIVRTLEHGVSPQGQPYIVLDLADALALDTLLVEGGGQLEGRRLPLIRQAGEALAFVHSAGYVHRNVCPRNFWVATDFNSLRLSNFSLAVPVAKALLNSGQRAGITPYLAPEVVRRRGSDYRQDVFAFGVVAYEMLSGRLPWATSGARSAAMQWETAQPADIREHQPHLHPRLAAAVAGCIHPDLRQRTGSLQHFLAQVAGLDCEAPQLAPAR